MIATPTEVDYLIIGAGPAGLQLAQQLAGRDRSYLVLEAGAEVGSFFRTMPRHRTLLSINKVHCGIDEDWQLLRWDWNSLLCDDPDLRFTGWSSDYFPRADRYCAYLAAFADRFRLAVRLGTRVTRLHRSRRFVATDAEGRTYLAGTVVVATGNAQPYLPPIPGIELADTYAGMSTDANAFTNRRVLVIGKGNSAFETASHLLARAATIHMVSPRPVRLAWNTHFPGDVRVACNPFLDSHHLKVRTAIFNATVDAITRRPDGALAVQLHHTDAIDDREELVYDHVLACTGFQMDGGIFDRTTMPALTDDGKLPRLTPEWESVDVPGLFFAGALMRSRHAHGSSGFVAGFRYNVVALNRMLEARHHGRGWPYTEPVCAPQPITSQLLRRSATSHSLWHQFGFLSDLLLFKDGRVRYLRDVPVAYAHGLGTETGRPYLLLTVEHGDLASCPDAFHTARVAPGDYERSHLSRFLHPVVRRCEAGCLRDTHHVAEDRLGRWSRPPHGRHLSGFVAAWLGS